MKNRDNGILCCVNCIGMHPDEPITMMTIATRLVIPEEVVAKQLMAFKNKKGLYKNKSCMLCGRTYDDNGDLDETWELTAKRVKMEFDNAGVHGVDDAYIKQVVASCIKSWKLLWRNRATITRPEQMEQMTFTGRMVLIITHAQMAREKKNTLNNGKKGLLV